MAALVEGQVKAGGVTTVVTASFTRPADTTQYTANDVVSNSTSATSLLVFKNCVQLIGGTGLIHSGLMFASTDAATNPNFDLLLFDNQGLTLAADNAAGTITDAEALGLVAAVTFDGTNSANVHTAGANLIIKATNVGQAFKCAQNTRDLYGVVIDRGAYTPASAEVFSFKLVILQD